MIFFAGFVWTAGVILTQSTLRADTVVYAIQGGNDVLGTLDLNTGVFTQTSTQALNDYELGVYGGGLYGANTQFGCLFQLNPSTGVPTLAPTQFNQNNNGFGAVNGFGSTTASLFVMGAAFGGINYLYSVNPTTGAPTQIGSTGITTGGGTGFLSASDDSTKLYWEVQNGYTDTLYSINTSTGTATLIGAFTFNGYSVTGDPFSMVFTGGTLWANFYGGGFGTISTSTGAQTLVSTAPTGSSNAFFGLAPYPASASAPAFVGSMPHLAAEGGWTTTFTYVNKGTTSAIAQTNLFAPNGTTLTLPINFPQTSSSTTASSVTQTIAPSASFIMQATGPANVTYQEGSAQLSATGAVDGFEIFHYDPTLQEAVVSLETRNAPSYLLAFDNTNTVVTGVAVGNVSATAASIPVVIRNDTGAPVQNTSISLSGDGHTSFVLSAQFPMTANIRGTIEFDTPAGGQISVLGIRYTPPGTMTTIPAMANVGTAGGSLTHIASGAGWQTTFVLVNTGTSAAQPTLNFFDDFGNPLALPLTFLQTGGGPPTIATSVAQPVAANASLWAQTTSPAGAALLTGSAQLTTTGNVSGFVIFRYNPNGQEAVVPLETRNASSYILAFDNTNGTATGVAVNAVSSLAAIIPVTLRDDQGNPIGGGGFELLSANGHDSFVLTTRFPQTANLRGTIEFDTPTGAQISVLGIRSPPALTFTTLPSLAK